MKYNLHVFLTSLFMYGMILLPGLLMVLNETIGSNFIGIIIISLTIFVTKIIFDANGLVVNKKFLIFYFLLFLAILCHLLFATILFPQPDNGQLMKSFLSLLSLASIILICYFVSSSIGKISLQSFEEMIKNIFLILLILGLVVSFLSLLGLQTSKKMLFFTEPSHYALVVSIFFCYKLSCNKKNLLYAIPLIFIALVVQNLTLIFGVAMAVAVNFLRFKTVILIPIILFSAYFLIVNTLGSEKLDYYFQRLNVTQESTNTSTLTLISGYEQAYLALRDSNGFGYGIQHMGYSNDRGKIVEVIGKLRNGNTDSNIFDGGLFISKLAVEFGVFGVLFFIMTLTIGFLNFKTSDYKRRFFSSILVMSSMYFLLRGSGYFTPSAVLIFISLVYIKTTKYNYLD